MDGEGTGAHRTDPRQGMALHARRLPVVRLRRLRRHGMAARDAAPRLGHLRPLQHRQRPAEHGHRTGRPEGGDGARGPHGRPSVRRQGVVPPHDRDRRRPRDAALHAAFRRRDEPRPHLRERPRGLLLAQRLQLVLVRRHALPARGAEHAGCAAREPAREFALVPRRRALPQRAPDPHRCGAYPRMGHADRHPRRHGGLRRSAADDPAAAPRRAPARRLYAPHGAARRRGQHGRQRPHRGSAPRRCDRAVLHGGAPRALVARNARALHLGDPPLRR